MSNPYTHSHPLTVDFRSTLPLRTTRVAAALGHVSAPHKVIRCKRASDTVVLLGSGCRILVSYNTPVAIRYADGTSTATPHGQYSRTTDRAVRDFSPNPIRVSVSEFAALLKAL